MKQSETLWMLSVTQALNIIMAYFPRRAPAQAFSVQKSLHFYLLVTSNTQMSNNRYVAR